MNNYAFDGNSQTHGDSNASASSKKLLTLGYALGKRGLYYTSSVPSSHRRLPSQLVNS